MCLQMEANEMVSPQVWNLSTSLCSACTDGRYEACHCNPEPNMYQLYKDLSCDSLDQCHTISKRKQTHSTDSVGTSHSNGSGFIFDNEFVDDYAERPLPASTTDWDSIDSLLEKEIDTQDGNHVGKTSLNRNLSQSFHMQMVFVESDSDKDSTPDVDVYYRDVDGLKRACSSQDNISYNEHERNIESRDSGYVTTDVLDLNIEHVTDTQTRRVSIEPVEASTRVLTSLELHENHEIKIRGEFEKQKQKDDDNMSEIHRKNVCDLKEMKETLELRIAEVNMELVQSLQLRDELNSYHESLLMDADDLKQQPPSNPITPTKRKTSAKPIESDSTPAEKPTSRIKSFWKR